MPNFKIYIGKNKSGKTYALENSGELKKDDHNVFYFPAEIDVNELIKEKTGTAAKPIWGPQKKLLDFINELYSVNSVNIINDEDFSKLEKGINEFKEIKDSINNENDEYWENIFLENIIINNPKKEITTKTDGILSLDKFKNTDSTSSGSKHYSLLKIVYQLIEHYCSIDKSDERKQKLSEYYLKFDEPEKFCHPELIDKIAYIIFNISKYMNVEVVTHSSLFLNKIFKLDSLDKEETKEGDKNRAIEYIYCFKDKKVEEGNSFPLDLKKVLKKENSRTIKAILESLFSSNLILVEGLNDEIFINAVYESEFLDKYLTIIDCEGKPNVKKYAEIMTKLNMWEHINICAFYEEDKDGSLKVDSNKIFNIMINNNLEEHFFEKHAIDENYKIKNNTKDFESKKNLGNYIIDLDTLKKSSTRENINELLENKISKIRQWISKDWKRGQINE